MAAAAKKARRRGDGDEEIPTQGSANPAVSISSSLPSWVEVGSSISVVSTLTDPTALEQFQDATECVAVPSVQYSDRNIEPSAFEHLHGPRGVLPLSAPAIPL